MKKHLSKTPISLAPILLFFSLIIVFSYCKKEDGNVGTGSVKKCCEIPPLQGVVGAGRVYVPNIFTPNEDGINDQIGVFANYSIETIESFVIKDKNGKIYFTAEDAQPNDFNYFWKGKDADGKSLAGIFEFELIVLSTDNERATFTGEFCSCDCGREGSNCSFSKIGDNLLNCKFGSQHNGEGSFDKFLATGENDCF